MMRSTHSASRPRPSGNMLRTRAAGAFTLIELMVSIALLVVVMVTLSQIFTVTSDAASRAGANSEVIAKSAAFQTTVADQLGKMTRGLLVIDCPAPTTARQETPGGARFLRLRHDRLVFLANGDVGDYQSFTDPTRGTPVTPSTKTAESSQALVYFGPGIPLSEDSRPVSPHPLVSDSNHLSYTLTASEWVFLHRSILLLMTPSTDTDPSWTPLTMDDVTVPGSMLDGGTLPDEIREGGMDVIVSGVARRASTQSFIDWVFRLPLDGTDLLSETPSIAALWEPSFAPRTASLDDYASLDYYSRSGSSFVRNMADFRIEWTDGRQDLRGVDLIAGSGDEGGTRWFGLRPDPATDIDSAFLSGISSFQSPSSQVPQIAVRRQDVVGDSTETEEDAFRDRIEWSRTGSASDVDAAYRAIWRTDTWQHRPTALRFTYRIYDAGNRLKHDAEIDLDEDGYFDPDGSSDRAQFVRHGRQFSIVVPLP